MLSSARAMAFWELVLSSAPGDSVPFRRRQPAQRRAALSNAYRRGGCHRMARSCYHLGGRWGANEGRQ